MDTKKEKYTHDMYGFAGFARKADMYKTWYTTCIKRGTLVILYKENTVLG